MKLNSKIFQKYQIRNLLLLCLIIFSFTFFFKEIIKKEILTEKTTSHAPFIIEKVKGNHSKVKKEDLSPSLIKKKRSFNIINLSEKKIDEKISTIDSIIYDNNYIHLANKKLLSSKEKNHFYSLLLKRDHLYKEKINRFIKGMDVL